MGAEMGMAAQAAQKFQAVPIQVAGGVMNLMEANKQADAKRAADRAAEKAVQEAQKQLEQNFLGAVQVPMGAYNNAVLQSVAKQGQAIGALQEAGPRELAGGIGRVNEVSNQETANLTENIADRLYGLSTAQAQEQALNADQIAALKQSQAQGAQMASMAAQKAKIALQQGALNAFGNAYTGGMNALTPTYMNNNGNMMPVQNTIQPPVNTANQLQQAVVGGINTTQPVDISSLFTMFPPTR